MNEFMIYVLLYMRLFSSSSTDFSVKETVNHKIPTNVAKFLELLPPPIQEIHILPTIQKIPFQLQQFHQPVPKIRVVFTPHFFTRFRLFVIC